MPSRLRYIGGPKSKGPVLIRKGQANYRDQKNSLTRNLASDDTGHRRGNRKEVRATPRKGSSKSAGVGSSGRGAGVHEKAYAKDNRNKDYREGTSPQTEKYAKSPKQ